MNKIIWLKCDIYNYKDVVEVMKGIDIVVYYLDLIKYFVKLIYVIVWDLNFIVVDNFGRVVLINKLKKIVYILGSCYDNEVIECLGVYGVLVDCMDVEVKCFYINVEL